jgi:hypothetical protein
MVVLCTSGATSILPITAGGAVAGMGTTAGVLFALGLAKGVAVNFAVRRRAPGPGYRDRHAVVWDKEVERIERQPVRTK